MISYKNGYGLPDNIFEFYLNNFYYYELYENSNKLEYEKYHKNISKILNNINNLKNKNIKDMFLGWKESYHNFPRIFDFSGLQISITDECQLNCKHCYNQNNVRKNKFVSLHEIKNYYNKIMSLKGYLKTYDTNNGKVTITGGEPFLNEELKEIINYFFQLGYRTLILTNGLIYKEEITDTLLKTNSTLQISIDGMKDKHNYIRGNGTFEKTVENIKKYIKNGVTVYISFTSNMYNYKEYPKVFMFFKNLGAKVIWQDRYTYEDGFNLKPLDKNATIQWNRYNNVLSITNNEICRTGLHRMLQETRNKPCTAGTFPVIDPYGNIKACGRLNIIIANLNESENSIAEKMLKFLIGFRMCPVNCIGCKNIKTCFGGSCCISYSMNKIAHMQDIGCGWINFKK